MSATPGVKSLEILSRLSRITTPGRKFIPQIDGLRFIAIMAVIAFHVDYIGGHHLRAAGESISRGNAVEIAFSAGRLGVELFFAVSGFILSLPFARWRLCGDKPVCLRDYYVRRVTRIEPPYVIHLAFLFLLCALVLRHLPTHPHLYHNPDWAGYAGRHILASLGYANAFFFDGHPYPNIVLWSLEVEVQFYILAPFLSLVFLLRNKELRRILILALIGLFPFAAGMITSAAGNPHWLGSSLMANLQYFLVGFFLADLHVHNPAPRRSHLWDVMFLLGGAALAVFCYDGWFYHWLPFVIGLCAMAAFRGVWVFRVLGNPWVMTIGGMCYTIYMYHWLMISLLIRLTIHLRTGVMWLDYLINFALMSAAISMVCAILFALFERPFMRRDWPSRLRGAIFGRFTRPAR